jgi:hypothetical protein
MAPSGFLRPKLADLLASAASLDDLCRDREVVGDEVFPGNEYYGIATVLKDYAGVPQTRPLKALVPHGVYLNDHAVAHAEATAVVPAVMSYPDYRAQAYRRSTDKVVLPSAAPFLYACEMLRADERPERGGTLVFPVHSTRFISANTDHNYIADLAAGLNPSGGTTSVCMYFHDVRKGHHKPYIDRGLNVVSAGHLFDTAFLYRLAALMLTHECVLTNSLGSHVFYAIAAGCSVRILDVAYEYSGDTQRALAEDPGLTPERQQEVERITRLFGAKHSPNEDQVAIASAYVGGSHLLTPEALADQIAWLDRLDARGTLFVRLPYAGRLSAPVPYRFRRPFVLATRVVRRLLRRILAAVWNALPDRVRTTVKGTLGRHGGGRT